MTENKTRDRVGPVIVLMPAALRLALDREARKRCLSRSAIVRLACQAFLATLRRV